MGNDQMKCLVSGLNKKSCQVNDTDFVRKSTIMTHLSSLFITSICCCSNAASVCASPPPPWSSDVSLPASLSMSDRRLLSNARATFFSTLSCSSFCHSCSLRVNTLVGESCIPARPLVSRLTVSLLQLPQKQIA